MQNWGRAIREAKSVVKVLVVEQTLDARPGLGRPVRRGRHLVPAVPAARSGDGRPAAGAGRDDLDLHGAVPGETARPGGTSTSRC